MLYSNDRGKIRDVFFSAWRKRLDGVSLDAMEQVIAQIIEQHPEYQAIVADPERNRERDDFPEVGDGNPFFHMGMHITVVEQLRINQPAGIREAFSQILERTADEHQAQHLTIDVLAAWLGEGPPHDEKVYIEQLLRLGKRVS